MTDTLVLTVSDTVHKILNELRKDGADDRTIGRRLHIDPHVVAQRLHEVRKQTGHPQRTALAVALASGRLTINARSMRKSYNNPIATRRRTGDTR